MKEYGQSSTWQLPFVPLRGTCIVGFVRSAYALVNLLRLGWADGASGHVSLRDPVNPDWFWINPYAKHFALMKASDLVLVAHSGRPVQPTPHKVNAAGFIIHSSIHRARPDINAACHLHSPHGRAWSAFGKGIEMLSQGL